MLQTIYDIFLMFTVYCLLDLTQYALLEIKNAGHRE